MAPTVTRPRFVPADILMAFPLAPILPPGLIRAGLPMFLPVPAKREAGRACLPQ